MVPISRKAAVLRQKDSAVLSFGMQTKMVQVLCQEIRSERNITGPHHAPVSCRRKRHLSRSWDAQPENPAGPRQLESPAEPLRVSAVGEDVKWAGVAIDAIRLDEDLEVGQGTIRAF